MMMVGHEDIGGDGDGDGTLWILSVDFDSSNRLLLKPFLVRNFLRYQCFY